MVYTLWWPLHGFERRPCSFKVTSVPFTQPIWSVHASNLGSTTIQIVMIFLLAEFRRKENWLNFTPAAPYSFANAIIESLFFWSCAIRPADCIIYRVFIVLRFQWMKSPAMLKKKVHFFTIILEDLGGEEHTFSIHESKHQRYPVLHQQETADRHRTRRVGLQRLRRQRWWGVAYCREWSPLPQQQRGHCSSLC